VGQNEHFFFIATFKKNRRSRKEFLKNATFVLGSSIIGAFFAAGSGTTTITIAVRRTATGTIQPIGTTILGLRRVEYQEIDTIADLFGLRLF